MGEISRLGYNFILNSDSYEYFLINYIKIRYRQI